jgi:SAM-dependent methyltransferase
VHVAQHLLSSGIKQGNALVLGSNEIPFTMLFKKMGFLAEGFSFHESLKDERENESDPVFSPHQTIWDLQGDYDIIICDDILQYLPSPAGALSELKDHMRPGGLLTITTPNIARGTSRLRLLTGRNVYPWRSGNETEDHDIPRLIHYREYTLRELVFLVDNIGLELIKSEFIIGEEVNTNVWPPMPLKEYLFQTFYYVVQKIAAALRNYLFMAARKPLSQGENGVQREMP